VSIPTPDAGAIRRAQSLSVRAAAATAVVPTALAAQGMVMVGRDALGLPLGFALALAAFLELALISSALLARACAMAGRPAGADAIAVWVFSTVSGLFSAAHELIGPPDPATGQRGWQHNSLSLLAAGVRIAAPLVAAWLWERVLVSARRQAAPRSTGQIRADHRLLTFARAAQTLRRLLNSPTATQPQIRRAHRQFDRRHVALLRHVPATDPALRATIQTWLTELFSADTLYLDWKTPSIQNLSDTPARAADSPDTRVHPTDISTDPARAATDISAGMADTLVTFPSADLLGSVSGSDNAQPHGPMSDTSQTWATAAGQVSGTVHSAVSDALSHSASGSGTTQALTRPGRPATDTATITPASCNAKIDRMPDSPSAIPDSVTDTTDEYPGTFADVSATLTSDRNRLFAAVDIVRTHGHLSGSDMAKQMGRLGHPMTERTGLRWRNRAEGHQQSARV
jgi:hypothetical protein